LRLSLFLVDGGNDGLNTVVPFADPEYAKLRPMLKLPKDQLKKVNDQIGLHPSLEGFAKLLQDQSLCIVQGVGYPNPSQSHFRSMDIWQAAATGETLSEGWIGKAQSAVSYQFAEQEGDWGFLIESVPMAPALVATGMPWVDGADHKRRYSAGLRHMAPFISVARDHGEGEVAIDQYGRAVVRWSLDDEVDRRLVVSANVSALLARSRPTRR